MFKTLALALLAALALAAPTRAATIAVTTTHDAPPPGCCSLRQALAAAQPGDVISLPASSQAYALRADLGELVVARGGVSIVGGGARHTVVSGGGTTRVLAVAGGVGDVTIGGLTITGGGATGDPRGGGVYVGPGAELNLRDAAVIANSAGPGQLGAFGGGIYNGGTLVLERSLVADNLAGATGIAFGQGGGIFNNGELRATNVTIARNTAGGGLALSGGGGLYTAAPGTSHLENATVAANGAAAIGTGANLFSEAARAELRNTIVAEAVGASSCADGVTSLGHNLSDSADCGAGAPRDAQLGPLRDNGGQTDTRLPQDGSPAIDAAADCVASDQRGFPRPYGNECDIGAAERGSTPAAEFPPPKRNATVDLAVVSGHVLYELPHGRRFKHLSSPVQVPMGTIVNTNHGVVTIAAARDDHGTIDHANFFDGLFMVTQERSGAGTSRTVITLRGDGASDCTAGTRATAAKSRKHKRRVWGDGKGTFRTVGKYSSATVRGTRWLTEDTCDATLTRVRRGVVDVEDRTTHKHVRVRAGSSYVARPPQACASRRRFRINVPVSQALHVLRATAVVAGRRVPLRREPHRVTGIVDLRGLVPGTFMVRVTIVLADGRVLHDTRSYRTCRPS